MEYLDQDLPTNGLTPTRVMREDWYNTARWANFLAIVGFISIGISVLGIGGLSTMLSMLSQMGMDSPGLSVLASMGSGLTIVMLILLGAQFMLNLFQFRFATQLKRAVQTTDQPAFEEAWLHFRNLFRWTGIMMIAVIFLYIGLAAMVFSTLVQSGE